MVTEQHKQTIPHMHNFLIHFSIIYHFIVTNYFYELLLRLIHIHIFLVYV